MAAAAPPPVALLSLFGCARVSWSTVGSGFPLRLTRRRDGARAGAAQACSDARCSANRGPPGDALSHGPVMRPGGFEPIDSAAGSGGFRASRALCIRMSGRLRPGCREHRHSGAGGSQCPPMAAHASVRAAASACPQFGMRAMRVHSSAQPLTYRTRLFFCVQLHESVGDGLVWGRLRARALTAAVLYRAYTGGAGGGPEPA